MNPIEHLLKSAWILFVCVYAALRRHIRKGFWRCAGNYHYIVITRMQMDVGDINKN